MLKELLSRLGLGESEGSSTDNPDRRTEDSWAESIGVELKGLITQAILAELATREEKYLLNILARSQFLIESLVVTPLDLETSRRFESFLEVHSQIAADFKNEFFKSLLETQYRSNRGALVTTAPDFQPTVQFLSESLEQPSQDEVYQVSLRGRRLRFRVSVTLAGPVARPNKEAFLKSGSREITPSPDSFGGLSLGETFVVKIWDAEGEREMEVTSPCILGRESPAAAELGGVSFVTLHGRYVSRRHLVLVSVMDETYFFLHEAASLSCLASDGSVLARSSVYSLPKQAALSLVMGAPEVGDQPKFGPDAADQFPMVVIARKGVVMPVSTQATPRPRAVR